MRALEDPRLSARVVERRPLIHDDEPEPGWPQHVRAGSALVWVGERLAVVQDDALFLALVDPGSGSVRSLALPEGPGGARLFDDAIGNKAAKLDLEAALALGDVLYAFGSGSTSARERVVEIRGPRGALAARILPAHRFYALLRATPELSGSELNLEGAAALGNDVVLLQRGNGRARGQLSPVDAIARVEARALVAYLDSADTAPPPPLRSVVQYDLGAIGEVRLGFTDATTRDGRLIYLAAAEDSPDVVRDGAVVGTAVGVIDPDGSARQCPITEAGAPFTGKAEGIAIDPRDARRAYVVLDRDDPGVPAELCTLELGGFD